MLRIVLISTQKNKWEKTDKDNAMQINLSETLSVHFSVIVHSEFGKTRAYKGLFTRNEIQPIIEIRTVIVQHCTNGDKLNKGQNG